MARCEERSTGKCSSSRATHDGFSGAPGGSAASTFGKAYRCPPKMLSEQRGWELVVLLGLVRLIRR